MKERAGKTNNRQVSNIIRRRWQLIAYYTPTYFIVQYATRFHFSTDDDECFPIIRFRGLDHQFADWLALFNLNIKSHVILGALCYLLVGLRILAGSTCVDCAGNSGTSLVILWAAMKKTNVKCQFFKSLLELKARENS